MSLAFAHDPAADIRLAVTVPDAPAGARLIAPMGMAAPEACITAFEVSGGQIVQTVTEPRLRLTAAVLEAGGGPLSLTYTASPEHAAPIPAEAFERHESAFTVAAAELAVHAQEIAQVAGGGHAGIEALVADASAQFVYGHADTRFNEGCGSVPLIACGGVPGSCVDINTYLVASLRAAGYEAAYITGYFFPAEKRGSTTDMHCWVLSRHRGEVRAWDIAHHKKMGATFVGPGLNPKPGERVAISHSMGHNYPAVLTGPPIKLLAEPEWLEDGTLRRVQALSIRMSRV